MRRRAEKMLAHLHLGAVELSVALVDDADHPRAQPHLPRKDKPTDVLAFPLQEGSTAEPGRDAR